MKVCKTSHNAHQAWPKGICTLLYRRPRKRCAVQGLAWAPTGSAGRPVPLQLPQAMVGPTSRCLSALQLAILGSSDLGLAGLPTPPPTCPNYTSLFSSSSLQACSFFLECPPLSCAISKLSKNPFQHCVPWEDSEMPQGSPLLSPPSPPHTRLA